MTQYFWKSSRLSVARKSLWHAFSHTQVSIWLRELHISNLVPKNATLLRTSEHYMVNNHWSCTRNVQVQKVIWKEHERHSSLISRWYTCSLLWEPTNSLHQNGNTTAHQSLLVWAYLPKMVSLYFHSISTFRSTILLITTHPKE
jgi:hypothetical protein